jgi:undecaprenyl-diphosphatase
MLATSSKPPQTKCASRMKPADTKQIPQLLSDHPANGDRIKTLRQHFRDHPSVFGKFDSKPESATPLVVPKKTPPRNSCSREMRPTRSAAKLPKKSSDRVVNAMSQQEPTIKPANATVLVLTAAGLLFAFGLIAQEVVEGKTLAFDREIMLALRSTSDPSVPIGPAWLPEAARDVTSLGSMVVLGIIMVAAAGYLFLAGKSAAAWLMLIAVIGGIVISDLLKFAFGRTRPDVVAPMARVFTTSFPSAHATMSAITYLTIGASLARGQSSSTIRLYFMLLAAFLTVLIGVSRIYLGVHYPTDVLAGWCIGAAWALGCWAVTARFESVGQFVPPKRW